MNQTCAVEAKRGAEKHLVILESIDSLEKSVNRLRDLVDKVSGEDQNNVKCAVQSDVAVAVSNPSLSNVLNDSSEAIAHQSSRVHELINSLEQLLY